MPDPHPDAEAILRLEEGALARWCRGDPGGFLELAAPDVSYFDPFLPRRLDGLGALTAYYEGLRGKISAERFELLHPTVVLAGGAAVLTFNFVSWAAGAVHRWNCTEVYRRDVPGWRIVQTHWSFTAPSAA